MNEKFELKLQRAILSTEIFCTNALNERARVNGVNVNKFTKKSKQSPDI